MLAANLNWKYSRSSGEITTINCLTSRAGEEFFGRVQPDGLVRQRRERLFVVLVVKPAALAGRRQDHGKLGHGTTPCTRRACDCESATLRRSIVRFRRSAVKLARARLGRTPMTNERKRRPLTSRSPRSWRDLDARRASAASASCCRTASGSRPASRPAIDLNPPSAIASPSLVTVR